MTLSPRLGPLGQVSRTVADIAASTKFFQHTLGLEHLFTFGKLAFFDCHGTRLYLQEVESTQAESVLYFRVADIDAEYRALQERGVAFKAAPHKIHTHDDGTSEWMVFFEDLEGRPLALMSQIPARAADDAP